MIIAAEVSSHDDSIASMVALGWIGRMDGLFLFGVDTYVVGVEYWVVHFVAHPIAVVKGGAACAGRSNSGVGTSPMGVDQFVAAARFAVA